MYHFKKWTAKSQPFKVPTAKSIPLMFLHGDLVEMEKF